MFVHPEVYTSPYAPILFCASVFLEALHVVGICIGLPLCWDTSLTPPLFRGASPSITPPHSVGSLCISMFQGYQYVMWVFPSVEGFGSVPHQLGGLGASALEMSIYSFLYIFVVHYVSHFDYGSNYYSSSYRGIFWPVISVISDSGSLP